MALIGEMKYLQIGTSVYEIPTSELPIASSSTLGGIKVGNNLSIDSSTGVLSASFTETDPVFSASAAHGITQNDIDSWNAKVSDTGKWNGVTLSKSFLTASRDLYVPIVTDSTAATANYYLCTSTPTADKIVRWDNDKYLYAATPSANDNSTKVATTAYVDAAIPDVSGFITAETDPTVPSWAKASTKPAYTASEVGAVAISAVGAASGVAPLNASSKIDSTYLPSYVDDIIEGYYYNSKFWKEAAHTTEITGEAGKIYVDLSTDKTYRYSGTGYVEVSSGSLVTVTRNLTSGTKSATISIDGTDYDIYSETNTDTKVKTTRLDTPDEQYHGVVFGSTTTATEEKYISNSLLFGISSISGASLTIGNNFGTDKANGILEIVRGSYYITLVPANLTDYRTITLPNKTGTIALTSDIPSAYTSTPSAPGTGSAGSSTSYSKGDHVHPKELPTVSSSDNNKVLMVSNGAWAAASLPLYQGGVS